MWKPQSRRGLSFFKASFSTFSFERHTHDEYAIGVIEDGAQRFTHKGAEYIAPALSIISVNPDEVHDGAPYDEGGYRYRMLYLGLPLLQDFFDGEADRKGLLAFNSPVTRDARIAKRLSRALELAETSPELIDEILPPILLDLFTRHATPRPLRLPESGNVTAVRRAIELIRERAGHNISLDHLAADAGLSKFHFLRLFKRETGVTPHAFILGRRVKMARDLLEGGRSPAEAALLTGFSDQSHLTRRLKTVYGVTPGSLGKKNRRR